MQQRDRTGYTTTSGGPPAVRGPNEKERSGAWSLLMVIPMALCCGGPAIFVALAAAGAAVRWGLGVGLIVLLGAGAALVLRHRRRACCPPGTEMGTDGRSTLRKGTGL